MEQVGGAAPSVGAAKEERILLRESVPPRLAGLRLDAAAAKLFPQYSRVRIRQWIEAGELTVDARPAQVREKVEAGMCLCVDAPPEERHSWSGEELPLQLVYADQDLLVVNKAAGMVVHPAHGHWGGTLVNALLHYDKNLARLPRAGIVHRLDRGTSGLLVVARSLRACTHLVGQLKEHSMYREYDAVVTGVLSGGGTVRAPLGRHPRDYRRVAVREDGRRAVSHYRVLRRFARHTRIRAWLETGRTHQLRVHLASLRHPLVGDPLYGLGRTAGAPAISAALASCLEGFQRQALHARRLALLHPGDNQRREWVAPPPADYQQLLAALEGDAAQGGREAESAQREPP